MQDGVAGWGALPDDVTPVAGTRFASPEVDESLRETGYAVLEERFDRSTVAALSELYASAALREAEVFRPTMTIRDTHTRRRLWDGVRDLTRAFLEPLFVAGTTEVLGGSFVCKPASEQSQRAPHQDPTVFDEARFVSLSLWVPLSDSPVESGTLHVLPGSHRMGNAVRPPDVDSFDDDVRAIALAESIPLEIEAGQIVVLDGATIHHSPPNRAGRERIAAICAVRSTGAEMHVVRSDGGRPSGTADVVAAGVETYRSRDLIDLDLTGCPVVAQVPYRPCTAQDLARSRGLLASSTGSSKAPGASHRYHRDRTFFREGQT
jgi:ectoine hydroxylase-related dioxygenase (phytanoyl-CoA dioxygenase family)